MENRISYLNRTYSDYKEALIEMSEKYYPELASSFNDASVGAWQIDLVADIADNLSYHIDRVYQETNIDSAQEKSSLYSIARNAGIKIPGPKGAMAEVKFSITLPISVYENNKFPIIKRGTKVSASSQEFELLTDIDFGSQFDENGASDRTITPVSSSNGIIQSYLITKLGVVVAGDTRIFRQTINASDVKPFMEILIPVENVMSIESIITVDGAGISQTPSYNNFYSQCANSNLNITRFYEVDNLSQNKIWTENGIPEIYKTSSLSSEGDKEIYSIVKGEWKPIEHKFITEYTDKGYLKIIFGAGNGESVNVSDNFNKWQMSRILNNNNLGVLPKPNTTMFILYRVGGGSASNVAKGAINKITNLNADYPADFPVDIIIRSLKVENTTPSISGKDMPSEKELKYLIKYAKAAQERCVTLKDYIDRILMLPPKYGTPFRVGVAEENNKIMIYLLGVDEQGKLTDLLPDLLVKNIESYLSEYRMINDYVEIKPGRIYNVGFDVDVIIDKNYNKNDVINMIVSKITDYMDINRHLMGEEIYVGDIEKEIGNIDGVKNLISLSVSNLTGGGKYSDDVVSQPILSDSDDNKGVIDLEASDWILYNEGDSMMEIKNPETDIKIRIKQR